MVLASTTFLIGLYPSFGFPGNDCDFRCRNYFSEKSVNGARQCRVARVIVGMMRAGDL